MKPLKDTINETILTRKLSDPKRIVIEEWLKEYGIKSYTINSDYEIDVNGDVDLMCRNIKDIPDYIQFGAVRGYFDCRFNDLTSLRGCPKVVGKGFFCNNNKLTSLEGCPEVVKGDFCCSYNKLTTLDGAPEKVGGSFYCASCTKKFTEKDIIINTDVKKEIIL